MEVTVKTCLLLYLLVLVTSPVYLSYGEGYDSEDTTADIPQYWYTLEDYHWQFSTLVDPLDIKISINNRSLNNKTAQLKKYNNVLHATIPLELEKSNHIIIRIKDNVVVSLDLFYAKSFQDEVVPEEYKPFKFHTTKNESICIPCHRLQANKGDIAPTSPADSLCYSCHHSIFPEKKAASLKPLSIFSDADLTATASTHDIAVVSWQCLACHQAEAIESEFIPDTFLKFSIKEGAQVAPLCYKCHPDKKKIYESYAYVHGPIGMGACNMCHDPHFSKIGKLLEDKPSSLCINCHEFEESLAKANIHLPLRREGCLVCHAPHGSAYEYQLRADINTLCLGCHLKIGKQQNNHPVTGHPVSGQKDPNDPDLPFSCVSCHNPHSSDYENLLPEEDPMMLCIECHKMGA